MPESSFCPHTAHPFGTSLSERVGVRNAATLHVQHVPGVSAFPESAPATVWAEPFPMGLCANHVWTIARLTISSAHNPQYRTAGRPAPASDTTSARYDTTIPINPRAPTLSKHRAGSRKAIRWQCLLL